jgi:hypothetical protein
MNIIEFCRRNDIANKLRAAIEDIENGNGYIVFDGLQDKGALVKVTYNGVNVVLSPGPLLVGFDEIPNVITRLPSTKKVNLLGHVEIQTSDALKPDEIAIVTPGENPTEPPQIIKITDLEEATPDAEELKLGQDIVDAVNGSRAKEPEYKSPEKTKKRRSTT